MKSLEHPDTHHLLAAQGWLELGNHIAANEELEKITAESRAHPDALEVRWHIYAKEKQWEACVDIARAIIAADPKNVQAWIHRSYALHELKRTQEAFDTLLRATKKFRKVWTIPYNLACYCAQLGRLDEAKVWFKKATSLDESAARQAGIDDPDLKPLWDSLGGTLWKRSE